MMMVHRFTGRFSLNTRALRGLNVMLGLLLCSSALQAAPVGDFDAQVECALETAEGAWADSLLDIVQPGAAYDEQVFTELSPILDSPEAIKLPEDQLLTD